MIESVILMSFYRVYGGAIGDMLFVWEQAGFFSYLLPFLLIFALVFGILSRMNLFKDNKAINGIIAFVIGLMALQFSFVPRFFSEIFPRLGLGLVILLIILILTGFFLDPEEKTMNWVLLGVGAVIVVVILIQTAGAVGWSSGWWWYQNWPLVAGVVFILAVIGIIVGGSKPSTGKPDSILMKALRGGSN